jgi:hypothetical protein
VLAAVSVGRVCLYRDDAKKNVLLENIAWKLDCDSSDSRWVQDSVSEEQAYQSRLAIRDTFKTENIEGDHIKRINILSKN